ncbi:MAG TPA: hypothetical protein VGH15_13045 [Caulobacteraceae bacterium]|jgi:hypothetical protein
MSETQPGNLVYVNRPEVAEVLVDAVRSIWIDGNTVRLELCVNRVDPPAPDTAPTGAQVTACRPVLTLAAALALLNGLKQMETALLASGQLKQVAAGPESVN